MNPSVSGHATMVQPDLDVLRKAQRGDERAFSIIVCAYQVPVFNYVLRLVGDRPLAEDLTQDVFLRVFLGLPRFSLRSKFTTWLYQVAKNRVVDELRARERRPRAAIDIDDAPQLGVVDPPFERREAIDAVWRAVATLDIDLKTTLLLREIAGLSYPEIAEVLGVAPATVKWRIYKAREEIQIALGHEGIRHERGARRVPQRAELAVRSLALLLVLVLSLAACGGSGNKKGSSGPSAQAQIKSAYVKFFSARTPISKQVALLQNGSKFKPALEAFASTPFAHNMIVTVSSVTLQGANKAKVVYKVQLREGASLPKQTGTAVRQNGTWKVGDASFCKLIVLQGSTPAACKS